MRKLTTISVYNRKAFFAALKDFKDTISYEENDGNFQLWDKSKNGHSYLDSQIIFDLGVHYAEECENPTPFEIGDLVAFEIGECHEESEGFSHPEGIINGVVTEINKTNATIEAEGQNWSIELSELWFAG